MDNLSQTDKKLTATADIGESLSKGFRELVFLGLTAVALFFLISLVTFDPEDNGWRGIGYRKTIANAAGSVGANFSSFSFSMIGVVSFAIPLMLAIYGHSIYRGKRSFAVGNPLVLLLRGAGLIMTILASASLAYLCLDHNVLAKLHLGHLMTDLPESMGGVVGKLIADQLMLEHFGPSGSSVLLATAALIGLSLSNGLSWLAVIDSLGKYSLLILNGFFSVFSAVSHSSSVVPENVIEPAIATPKRERSKLRSEPAVTTPATVSVGEKLPVDKLPAISAPVPKKNKPSEILPSRPGELPNLDLLNQKSAKIKGYSEETLDSMARLLESILADFGVEVEVVDVHPGPVITRFEVQPAPGVKASRISGLAKDLARALSVTSVRVVEIIPGKSVIGLEIPNEEREIVLLHSVLASESYRLAESPLTMVLGKDIGGKPVVANLARMPHLLVAGTTGSGKSVAVNVMILSMLFKAGPDQVRMIMIDPKMLELSIYEGIPHLLTPVVTDMKEAANALRWSVAEMERRYKLMSMLGVRNLAGYNQKISEAAAAGEFVSDPLWKPDATVSEDDGPPNLTHLPFIVIVIDELADMMMIVGKKVEELIARLAQKARAAGIHLILATQRPSVDVLTGLIKANIPTRLSFQVSSRIDSRTIIDQGGAESLLGNGDMLFLPPGSGIPMRAHGAFVSDQEVHNVVEFLRHLGKPDYIEAITRFSEDAGDGVGGFKSSGGMDGGDETDALYDEAVRFVTESRKASISSVQRRFKVGYNRAARMIEDMEKAGIVGPAETNGSRAVLAPPPPLD